MEQNNLERWKIIIEEQRQSGKTQKDFCREQNIKLSTLHYWQKKIRKTENEESREQGAKLIRVPVHTASEQTHTPPIVLETPGNYRLLLHPGFSGDSVKRLLELL